jgi:hypothetical protein
MRPINTGDPIDLQERSMTANGVIVRKRFRRSVAVMLLFAAALSGMAVTGLIMPKVAIISRCLLLTLS